MRDWGGYVGWVALSLTFLFVGVMAFNDYRSKSDREALHHALELQREVLDARAEITVMLVRAASEGRALNEQEKRRYFELCERAQYERIPWACSTREMR